MRRHNTARAPCRSRRPRSRPAPSTWARAPSSAWRRPFPAMLRPQSPLVQRRPPAHLLAERRGRPRRPPRRRAGEAAPTRAPQAPRRAWRACRQARYASCGVMSSGTPFTSCLPAYNTAHTRRCAQPEARPGSARPSKALSCRLMSSCLVCCLAAATHVCERARWGEGRDGGAHADALHGRAAAAGRGRAAQGRQRGRAAARQARRAGALHEAHIGFGV